ncbi:glycosyltransferase involved in cell wall biosynthesis [Geomicrobium halophilum]|uniref:Glycosyltransferase involved in cell wall biosynthesis n=1 Tax=Geomicrobium halophilum TaxID=549000 RepID=A0A841PN82_9BACL|nr:glycosyltransferase family 4 protein [Geomicrobium halophilum]MBB6449214.1 glycosyltransferase involved in cell wall biosynthesis [Geomicrobium halophilum]
MPTSWYQVIPEIIDQILVDQPQSILDMGIGFGKYGVLLREVFDIPYERYEKNSWSVKIDGIEGFERYRNPLHDYAYNHVYYESIDDLLHKLPVYDTVLLIDVLEHFEKEAGLSLIKKLLQHTNKSLLISTPLDPAPQQEYMGNKLEHHKSRWSIPDFRSFDFQYKFVPIGENGAHLIKVYPPSTQIKTTKPEILDFPERTKRLKIGYVLPHRELTGGLKMLIQQMEKLKARGHEIHAFLRGDPESKVLPDWAALAVNQEIAIPAGELYIDYVEDCDIVVAGWYQQIPELECIKPPLFYWEQGHESLFGDIPNLPDVFPIREEMKRAYQSSIPIVSVSAFVSDVIKARFSKSTAVLTNGVDSDLFFNHGVETSAEGNVILLVGNPALRFKGFDSALETMSRAWHKGYRFQVNWVCQYYPQIREVTFPIQFVINPNQHELDSWYRMSDIHLFTSMYEGFGMPPLEAMASGVAVIATRCGGVEEYAKHGQNCLLVEPQDIPGMTAAVCDLLDSPEKRNRLAAEGKKTALHFSYDKIIAKLESFMMRLAEDEV